MGRIFPILLGLGGLGVGLGAGIALRPSAGLPVEDAETVEAPAEEPRDYVDMQNQFVIPVVENGRVASLVILSLSLEVDAKARDSVFGQRPRIRDAFLQVLFDHANVGGFKGPFTDAANLVFLRRALKEKATDLLGPIVSDVLITDFGRQDS